jgi:hypothetical protein
MVINDENFPFNVFDLFVSSIGLGIGLDIQ